MKAYLIAYIDVVDQDSYAEYTAKAPATIAAFGGQYLVRNGTKYEVEGSTPDKRVVVVEFPSIEKAKAWYASEAYQSLIKIRQVSTKDDTLFFIEGCEAP